jgi:2-polyprenyl-3-methyl-5-hydroxy-6-metoxy-1,4-benzoquinol methylase
MASADRVHWDERYAGVGATPLHEVGPPRRFAAHDSVFPTSGRALELACGGGRSAVWLASRGLEVWATDVSPVAIGLARDLARRGGVGHRCHFAVADLDDGIPPGPPVDVVVCNMFRDPRLDHSIVARLVPGGLLAVATLSEVGAGPGHYRARAGELLEAFAMLDVIDSGERDGEAWLLGRRTM